MQIIIGLVVVAVIAAGAVLVQNREETATNEPVAVATETTRPEEVVIPEPAGEATLPTSAPADTAASLPAEIPSDPNDPAVSFVVDEPAPSAPSEDRDFDPSDDERTFTANASYFTPRRTQHDIEVTLTLKDRVVVDANVTYDGGAAATPNHTRFDDAYRSEVIGKRLNQISLSRTGGASLTSEAFNEAVDTMLQQS
jgi:hypothetical protein